MCAVAMYRSGAHSRAALASHRYTYRWCLPCHYVTNCVTICCEPFKKTYHTCNRNTRLWASRLSHGRRNLSNVGGGMTAAHCQAVQTAKIPVKNQTSLAMQNFGKHQIWLMRENMITNPQERKKSGTKLLLHSKDILPGIDDSSKTTVITPIVR